MLEGGRGGLHIRGGREALGYNFIPPQGLIN